MRRTPTTITVMALALTLAACGGNGDDNENDGGNGDGGSATDDAGGEDEGADAASGEIVVGVHSGWEEGIAASHLMQHILEEQGYDVTLETAEAGVVFTGLAEGDYDVNFDTWPSSHASYLDEYGDDLEELGAWYEDAVPFTIAVNEDAPITSLDELAENADEFDNRLVGIEAGAGLTQRVEEQVIPTYGLEDMEYVISSTPAMLTELSAATDAGDNIAVTLWRPHWAYDAFPIRDLEDPEGVISGTDDIYSYGNAGFSEEFPEAAEIIRNFTMNDEQLAALENIMFNEMGGDSNDEAVRTWLEENPDYVDSILSGEASAGESGSGAGAESGSESGSEG